MLFSGEGPQPEEGNKKTRTSIHPGLYLDTCDRQPPLAGGNAITRLISHHAPLTILFIPVSCL